MKIDQAHTFDVAEAGARIKALMDYWDKRHNVDIEWSDARCTFTGKVRGVKFSGEMRIGDRRIEADVKAGFLAEKLGGRAYVERKMGEYLDGANSLESLQARI